MSVSSMMLLFAKIQELKVMEITISKSGQPVGETYSKKVVTCLEEIYKILQEHDADIAAIKAALG